MPSIQRRPENIAGRRAHRTKRLRAGFCLRIRNRQVEIYRIPTPRHEHKLPVILSLGEVEASLQALWNLGCQSDWNRTVGGGCQRPGLAAASASIRLRRMSLIRVKCPPPLDLSQSRTLASKRTLTGILRWRRSRSRTI